MHVENTFTAPGYYKHFICKAGGCRHTCCEGFSINITQKEYHRLVGLDCSKELREKLDLALYVLAHPNEYKYACISPTYTGRCRMLDENGLCSLQKECGADILTRVCKYYPRHPVLGAYPECSMSNSCEVTLELFLRENSDWTLEELPLSFSLAAVPSVAGSARDQQSGSLKTTDARTETERRNLRHALTFVMAQTAFPLSTRLRMIRVAVTKDLIIGECKEKLTERGDSSFDANLSPVHTQALISLLRTVGEEYSDLTLPARHAEEYLSRLVMRGRVFDEDALDKATKELQAHFSKLTAPVSFHSYISKTIANGMFYHGFPFGNEAPKSPPLSAMSQKENPSVLRIRIANALTILDYTVFLLTAVLIANRDNLPNADSLVDLTAAFSRMVDLSDFDKRVLAAHSSHDSDFPEASGL